MKHRKVLITGACGGIGRVLCKRYVEFGDHVYAQDLPGDGLNALVKELGADKVTAVPADITNLDALRAQAIDWCNDIDVLVANAGAANALTLQQTKPQDWYADMNLNLNGTFHCVELVRAGMQSRRSGNLVLIGSVNGFHSLGHPAYSVAKAGLIQYTKALAMELGKFGIRANMICPGTVKTQAWQARVDKNPQVFESLKKWYPLQDFATPDDIADASIFLSSNAARVITGVALPVDGGLMAGNRVMAGELTQEEI